MDTVFSGHAYRVNADEPGQEFPLFAPAGKAFYIITDSPLSRKRMYLREVFKTEGWQEFDAPKVVFAPAASMGKQFHNLRLAEAYCEFLGTLEGVQDTWIVLEG